MKLHKDCTIKGHILRCIADNIVTARAIFDKTGDQNYDSFKAEMFALHRRGYISIINEGKKPSEYTLTPKGQEHADYILAQQKRKQEKLQSYGTEIPDSVGNFERTIGTEVENMLPPELHFTDSDPGTSSTSPISDFKVIESIGENDVSNLKDDENNKEKIRIQRRRKIAEMYSLRNKIVDAEFFRIWSEVSPHKLENTQLFQPGSVEITIDSNQKAARDNTKIPMDAQEILNGQYHIINMSESGIVIEGLGLPGGKATLYW